ncbi:hypothetical protein BKA70DRAFT_1266916 [Coprinopsis sp. MPI-PUGE-AT-0042]|nr:hypothetical protein BKA70DRAFT_1266916 [Coprinopsis sp. MPI-PUGE-AT-0042]
MDIDTPTNPANSNNLAYTLESAPRVQWSNAHEKTISTEYPLDPFNGHESTGEFVQRTYSEFLWLPQSIMPLHLLVPSIQRASPPASSTSDSEPPSTSSSACPPSAPGPHPLHAPLDEILLTSSSVTTKYQKELPQILIQGGGAGEMEETMMWYAVSHEKGFIGPEQEASQSQTQWTGSQSQSQANGFESQDLGSQTQVPEDGEQIEIDEPWLNSRWRAKWLSRMERREVQIQILLYLLKLSLPGPLPAQKCKSKKRKRRPISYSSDDEERRNSNEWEDHLEAFGDRLSTWQLVSSLDDFKRTTSSWKAGKEKEERDWMQVFIEDLVEPEFKAKLPHLCTMLRSKVFPSSPFGDTDTESGGSGLDDDLPTSQNGVSQRPPSMSRAESSSTKHSAPSSRAISRAPSMSRATSGTSSRALSRAPSISRNDSQTSRTTASAKTHARELARARSRSLSVALGQESRDRATSVGVNSVAAAGANRRRPLTKEVSMSRAFKPKPAAPKPPIAGASSQNLSSDAPNGKGKEREKEKPAGPTVLVEETPVIQRTKSFAFGVGTGGAGLKRNLSTAFSLAAASSSDSRGASTSTLNATSSLLDLATSNNTSSEAKAGLQRSATMIISTKGTTVTNTTVHMTQSQKQPFFGVGPASVSNAFVKGTTTPPKPARVSKKGSKAKGNAQKHTRRSSTPAADGSGRQSYSGVSSPFSTLDLHLDPFNGTVTDSPLSSLDDSDGGPQGGTQDDEDNEEGPALSDHIEEYTIPTFTDEDEDDEDEKWQIDSSPDVLLLTPSKAEFGIGLGKSMLGAGTGAASDGSSARSSKPLGAPLFPTGKGSMGGLSINSSGVREGSGGSGVALADDEDDEMDWEGGGEEPMTPSKPQRSRSGSVRGRGGRR